MGRPPARTRPSPSLLWTLSFRWIRRSGLTLIFVIFAVQTFCTWYRILHHDTLLRHASEATYFLHPHPQRQRRDGGNDSQKQSVANSGLGDTDQHYESYDFSKDWTSDLVSDSVTVFYNIYLPSNEQDEAETMSVMSNDASQSHEAEKDAPAIFRQQMSQLNAYYNRQPSDTPRLKVYYNTIGEDGHLTDANVICKERELDCIHMHHYQSGQEDVTLQNLYDYCQQQPSPNARVTYLHAKGSYHKTTYNEKNRVTSTFSVLNKCLNILGTRDENGNRVVEEQGHNATTLTCDVCGGQFLPIWGPFFSTNMWAAECSYIKQLIPPREFGRRMQELHDTLWGADTNKTMTLINQYSPQPPSLSSSSSSSSPLFQHNFIDELGPFCLGTGRYSNEHWVASHPTLRPCDARGVRMGTPLAPRSTLAESTSKWKLLNTSNLHNLLTSTSTSNMYNRRHEYFLLPGYLYRWAFLYKQFPSSDSWVWQWFPDGAFWKEKANQYGLDVVRAVLKSYTS